jgi:uncharacterized FlaG/YvyC family protein
VQESTLDFTNVNPDAKGYAAPVASNVELEDLNKPPVQPVPEDGEADTVKLDDKALHGKKDERGSRGDSSAQEEPENSEPSPEELPTQEQLEQIVEEITLHFKKIGSSFAFNLHTNPHDDYIAELRDMKTNEIVKQVSVKEIVRLHEKLQDMTGILFDQEV